MRMRLLTVFTLGVIIGGIAMFGCISFRQRDPVMSCSGSVQLDATSNNNLGLDNAIFIDDPDAPSGRMYVRFKNDRSMNDAIGKRVKVTGPLKSVQLDNGASITELEAADIQYLP